MTSPRWDGDKSKEMVAVAIDKDKGSQAALKWACDHLLGKGKRVTLLHVKLKPLGSYVAFSDNNDAVKSYKACQIDSQTKELFLPFRCFCTRKDIQVDEVCLEDTDVARALCEYVKQNSIENLVMGATSRGGFVRRLKSADVATNVSKEAPEFCNVYVISKGKISSVRSASITAVNQPPRQLQNQTNTPPAPTDARFSQGTEHEIFL
ncbi:Protein kinase protein with adenine nucleotide alpha hydrolase-like domain [Forsythia ovata]|uniref:RING-type E3 ubiquitin transferase n=1 Tax=Forsythia ovata TaxID=205694 RepID=A0ABD1SRF2_9LAMI